MLSRRTLLLSTGALGLPLPALARNSGASRSKFADEPLLQGLAPVDALPQPLPVTEPGRLLLNRGWLFHEGDIDTPPPVSHNDTYGNAKAGNARGPAAINFDDSDWQPVTLPHDWASHQPFVQTANVSQGYRPRGIGWYRRTLRLDPAQRGKKLELQFGAVATEATVWINGSRAARNFSGYNGFTVDLTPYARFGDDLNQIVVKADAVPMEGWWYEGAGIYRDVWLAVRPPLSIATDGVYCDPRLIDGQWRVPVAVTLESVADAPGSQTVTVELRDPNGGMIVSDSVSAQVPALGTAEARLTLNPGAIRPWSIEQPTLYTVTVIAGEDRRVIPIGFRTIRFDADRGFLLNDRPVKLKGVCLHQDHAGTGVAVPDTLLEWRLWRMKDMGVNAIRCSHNAQAEAFYHLCDRMGFVVMDENRVFNPAPENLAQLTWLVRAHRNHPSIVLWSVFNEEPMQGTASGVAMVRRMQAAVRALDDSRPVTAAMNGSFYDPVNVSQVVDVMGFNYYQGDYDGFHAANPRLPVTSSEDTSAFMTRGAYATDRAAHVMSSMDDEAADWGATHRKAWAAIAARPFVAGGFVWTGFDYHGEPTPFEWPTTSSFFGILDLCGFAKTAYDIHRAHWIDDQPVVAVAPHWTWPGREGKPIDLLVTSNTERVRVIVNRRIVGEAACDRIMGNSFTVPYAPGTLEVQGLRGGRVVTRSVHRTAGPAVALRLTPARTRVRGDGEDAMPVTIDAVDADGNHVPTENRMVTLSLNGASIIGLGNGDPNSHEPEKGDRRSLFNGLAQAILLADEGAGHIVLKASADGLRPVTLTLPRIASEPRPFVPVQPSVISIRNWRRSPATAAMPDPASRPADGDNNLWAFVNSGTRTPPDPTPQWRVYRAELPVRRRIRERGGVVRFAAVAGNARFYADGVLVSERTGRADGAAELTIPPGTRFLSVLVQSVAGAPSGITGQVSLSAE